MIELTNIDDAASGNNDALRLSPMLRNGDDALHARKNQDNCNNQDDRNQNGKVILVTQIPGTGKAVSYYSGRNPLKLAREICAASPAIMESTVTFLT